MHASKCLDPNAYYLDGSDIGVTPDTIFPSQNMATYKWLKFEGVILSHPLPVTISYLSPEKIAWRSKTSG